ncbi:MAG TPA: TolC family protein [Chitinophagales bacterium]|nr:TolC family protein [Chitinophagales bacterium]
MQATIRTIFTQLLLFILFVCASITTQAQNTLSIVQCITYAEQNNLQIKQLGLNEQTANENLRQAKANQYPNLSANASHSLSFGRNIDPTTNSFNTASIQSQQWGISGGILLYQGGLLKRSIAQRNMQVTLAQLESESARTNLKLNVLTAYLNILLAQSQLKVLQQQTKLTAEQYTNTQKLVNAGLIPEGNLLDLQAQQQNEALNITTAQNAVDAAYLGMGQLMNYTDNYKIVEPTVSLPSAINVSGYNVEQTYQTSLTTQPSIKTASLRTKIAQQGLSIAQSGRMPSIALSGGLNTRWSSLGKRLNEDGEFGIAQTPYFTSKFDSVYTISFPFEDDPYFSQISNNFGNFLGLNVSIPIYNRREVKTSSALAQIGIANAHIAEQIQQQDLRQTIERALLDARAAAQKYEAVAATITAQQKAFDFAQKKYNLGTATALELFAAQNALTLSQLNAEAAKYDYIFKLKLLDYYAGQPITF